MPRKLSWTLGLALVMLGCEDKGVGPSGGSSLMYFTFGGTVVNISGEIPGRADARGVQLGDSVYYVFAVDTLRLGYERSSYEDELRVDSSDRPGKRPQWFFDSLLSVPLMASPSPTVGQGFYTYVGYRIEQENGYAGTFLTNRYQMIDSSLLVAVCFNDFVGGPTLPSVGDIVSGTEQFALNLAGSSTNISSELTVQAIGRSPVFPE